MNQNQNQNVMQLIQQFNEFKRNINGKDPKKILNELLSSGRYTQEQVNQAKTMAEQFKSLLK